MTSPLHQLTHHDTPSALQYVEDLLRQAEQAGGSITVQHVRVILGLLVSEQDASKKAKEQQS